jgi:nitrate reductase gamma subunit
VTAIVLGVVVGVAAALGVIVLVWGRRPSPPDHVTSAWRNEQLRGRRE